MRLGVAWVPDVSNSNYRAIDPLVAMADRGHDVVGPGNPTALPELARVAECDLVHVYRRTDPAAVRLATTLRRAGVAITYDNDDDMRLYPGGSAAERGRARALGRKMFAASIAFARAADGVTTTNETLAARYREAGARQVAVIGNALRPNVPRPRIPHDGVVIGWIAGTEHWTDAAQIPILDALRHLTARHEHVHVECIGVDLGLAERYRHDRHVPFDALPGRVGGWDLAIAPLADDPFNHARSDIKLKEYAASGVPWLASPVGPYAELGEHHGGRLVSDDGWLEALERLVCSPQERDALGRAGRAWAATQTIAAVADRWEQVFAEAVERARARASAPTAPPGPSRGRRSPRAAR